jgi:hypothetical protein
MAELTSISVYGQLAAGAVASGHSFRAFLAGILIMAWTYMLSRWRCPRWKISSPQQGTYFTLCYLVPAVDGMGVGTSRFVHYDR